MRENLVNTRVTLWMVAAALGWCAGVAGAATPAAPKDSSMDSMSGLSMPGVSMPGMDMSPAHDAGAHGGGMMAMHGALGPWPPTREASGSAWQPDHARHEGLHAMRGAWMTMLHGALDVVGDDQGGPRGGRRVYATNMLMAMAQRDVPHGTLGVHAMVSAEPATIGARGYPLLLQSGETADGRTPLIDRQHPHDLLMELSGSYAVTNDRGALFVYAGLPGEPALGPPAYMHRFSAVAPQAPITHHWLDSTHITWGVVTGGAAWGGVKLEGSAFRGREPDEHRADFETPKLDSWSARVSVNPDRHWALQVSHGHLTSPEQLEPDVDQDRTTVSAVSEGNWHASHWGVTAAWGRDRNAPGHTLDAALLEAALELNGRHTVFVRGERVAKDELFVTPDPRAGRVFHVGELSAGYRFDFWRAPHLVMGIGASGTVSRLPAGARDAYGDAPASGLVFLHGALR
jgi:hypothetical protein